MACPPHDTFQIGWICALPIEAAAAKEMLDENFGNLDVQDPVDPNAYTLGRIGKHHVVIACLPGGQYGTTSATTVANHMTRTFSKSFRIGLMVGVGGGMPSVAHDVRLGDIVISCPEGASGGVLQYDMGKINTGGEMIQTGSLSSPPRSLLTAVNLVRATASTDDPLYPGYIVQSTERNSRTQKTFRRPGTQHDRLFKSDNIHPEHTEECDNCLVEWEETRTVREGSNPHTHYGIIASGNALIKDAKTREQLRLKTGALCCEMEAAGLMMDFPCIVIRGICDYADSHKNKQWQGYAALAAASYAKELLGYIPRAQVSQESLVATAFKEIGVDLEGIRDLLGRVHNQSEQDNEYRKQRALTDQQRDCHQVFKIGNYEEQKDINPPREDGTCQWALKSSQYTRWKDSNHNDLLWISADPGCGKSVLAKSIIDSYVHASSPPTEVTICYFFFKENEEQSHLAAALCSVLHQLFSQQPHLLHHAIPSWQVNGKALQKEVDQLWRIFIEATSSDTALKTICVFDALDECCEVDQDRFMKKVKSFHQQTCHPRQGNRTSRTSQPPNDSQPTQDTSLKILVTSRPYHHIQSGFRAITGFPLLHLKGEEENDQIHQEIDLVVRIRLKELAQTESLSSDIQHQFERQLLQMKNRTYLWLHLAIDDIRATLAHSLWPAEESLRRIPPSVEKAYDKILSRISSKQESTVRMIFKIIIAARRPLTTREMAMALGISSRPSSRTRADAAIDVFNLDNKLRSLCGLFVFVNNSKVYLIHQTARDYLLNEAASHPPLSVYSCSLESAEDQMARICLRYLSMLESDNQQKSNSDPADLLEYSAIYWADHVRTMSSNAEMEADNLLHHVYNTAADGFSDWFSIFWRLKMSANETKGVPILSAIHLAAINGHRRVITRLLAESQCDPNVADTAGSYPLTYACLEGHCDVAILLIEHGSIVNAEDGGFGNALRAACLVSHAKTAQVLLEHGADPTGDGVSLNPLGTAGLSGSRSIVEMLLAHGADLNADGVFSKALSAACIGSRFDILQLLLRHGALPNIQSEATAVELDMAVLSGTEKVLEILLDHGAIGSKGLLRRACMNGEIKIVKMLLDHRSRASASAEDHASALLAACCGGDRDMVHLLLEHRATTQLDYNLGDSLRIAITTGYANIVQTLLDFGAALHDEDQDGTLALRIASNEGHDKVVRALIRYGAKFNPEQHHEALKLACFGGYHKVVYILLTHGPAVNDQELQNSLHAACLKGQHKCVSAMLTYGMDLDAEELQDSLLAACIQGYDKAVHQLLQHGAKFKAERFEEALVFVCMDGHDSTLLVLLAHRAVLNPEAQRKALRSACLNGHDNTVKILLDYGAGINNADRQQALFTACVKGHENTVQTLLTYSVDPSHRGAHCDHFLLLCAADKYGHEKVVQVLLDDCPGSRVTYLWRIKQAQVPPSFIFGNYFVLLLFFFFFMTQGQS